MSIHNQIEFVWLYSHYYGDMLFTALRLHSNEESYSAMLILFNAVELIFKSIRENYNQNFIQDINALTSAGILTEEEKEFFNNEKCGLRNIRNIMMHKEAYQYCIEDSNGTILPFTEQDTWTLLFAQYSEKIINIIYNALCRK